MRRRSRAVLPWMILATLAAGCGGGSAPRAAKPTPTPAPLQGLAPPPASEPNAGPGTPGRATLQFLRYVQVGAVPPALLSYEEDVRRQVDIADLAGGVLSAHDILSTTQLQVLSSERLADGALVLVEGRTPGAAPRTWAFTLRRRGADWKITYDTLMEERLRAYVIGSTQEGIKPGAKPSVTAIRRGNSVGSAFRTATLSAAAARTGADAAPTP